MERNDYLATIRRLERDGLLLHGLLERMAPLVRRDCNYSNVDRLKKEALWDEESGGWRLPDVAVQKTTLPSGSLRATETALSPAVTTESVCPCLLFGYRSCSLCLTAVASKPAAYRVHNSSAADAGDTGTVRVHRSTSPRSSVCAIVASPF